MRAASYLRLPSLLLIACAVGCDGLDETKRSSAPGGRTSLKPVIEVPPREPQRLALLIGCTKYDNLPEFASLRGPANDVRLMSSLLRRRFKFQRKNIRTLVEGTGNISDRPIRKNIERAFGALIADAVAGDEVVIFLSGHGSQQPDDDPENSDDPEPDGMDEVFCPADIKSGIAALTTTIPNAITDDELRHWTGKLRAKGASLWFIVDACHSGTLTRGTEVARQLRPEQLLSREVLAAARPAAPATRGVRQKNIVDEVSDSTGGMVAIYAAQPHEPTYEMALPRDADADDQKWHGILTYTIAKILTESPASMTYSELVQRVHADYVTAGRYGPTPMVEGGDRHREILGHKEHAERSRWLLESGPDGVLRVAAGRLHGLTPGSVLAVYPPPGERDEKKLLGHVRLKKVGSVHALVVPCKHAKIPLMSDLPLGGRCRLAYLDYGKLRLKVALDESQGSDAGTNVGTNVGTDVDTDAGLDKADAARWRSTLKRLADHPQAVFVYEENLSKADWLVRPKKGNRIELLPTAGWDEQLSADDQRFGVVAIGGKAENWLTDRLGRIARARNLLKVADFSRRQRNGGWLISLLGGQPPTVRMKAELVRLKNEDDEIGTPVDWKREGRKLKVGQLLALRVKNTCRHPIDVSVLFLDSGFGIESVFPLPDVVGDNRLPPQGEQLIGPFRVEETSLGLEHLVIVAVRATGQPIDFTWLAQDSIEQARSSVATRSATAGSLDSPLGQLLQQAMYAGGTVRGATAAQAGDAAIDVVSWQTTK